MQLKPDFARATAADLEGEATVLVKIRRLLGEGERHNVVHFLANQDALPAEMRADFDKAFEDEELSKDMFVTGPAALVTPVAVYR